MRWEDQAPDGTERLTPGVEKSGGAGQPEVAFTTLHRPFVVAGVTGAAS